MWWSTEIIMWFALFAVCIPPVLSYYAPGKQVCYPVVGCFNHTYPFNNTDYLPDSPKELDVKLKLFTQQNRQIPDSLSFTDQSFLTKSHFDADKPVKVLIHGFISGTTNNWITDVKNEFVNNHDYNVVEVDWSKGSAFPYGQAVVNARLVAVQVTLVLRMMEEQGLDREKIHIIGHSLGAHIAGDIGHSLDSRIGRITSLDAAKPNYEHLHPLVVVDISDAMFVDAIHTDGSDFDIWSFKGYGLKHSLGHVDFYPNGGETQPGCDAIVKPAVGKRQFDVADVVACSHVRAHQLFARSIKAVCPFKSFTCSDYESYVKGECTDCNDAGGCSSMGFHADKFRGRGKQYLKTTGKDPFCGYQYKVVATMVNSSVFKGKLYIRIKSDTGFSTSAAILNTTEAKMDGLIMQGVIIVDRPIIPVKTIYAHFKPFDEADETPFVIKELKITSLDDDKRHAIIPGTYSVGGEKGIDMPVYDFLSTSIG